MDLKKEKKKLQDHFDHPDNKSSPIRIISDSGNSIDIEKPDIQQVIEDSTKRGPVYNKNSIKFTDKPTKPKPIFTDKFWRFNKMPKFDFIKEATTLGLAVDGRINLQDNSSSNIIKKLIILTLINFRSVKLMLKKGIYTQTSAKSGDGGYYFTITDIRKYISYHFPDDLDLIKKSNPYYCAKTIYENMENNLIRDRLPLNLMGLNESTKGKKVFWINMSITNLNFDQMEQLLQTFKNQSHVKYKEIPMFLAGQSATAPAPKTDTSPIIPDEVLGGKAKVKSKTKEIKLAGAIEQLYALIQPGDELTITLKRAPIASNDK